MSPPENEPKESRTVVLLLHYPLRLGLAVTHRHSVGDLIRFGRDLEKVVLSRAIGNHLRWKVIVHRGRTVVFD